jgi:hypothetical protein
MIQKANTLKKKFNNENNKKVRIIFKNTAELCCFQLIKNKKKVFTIISFRRAYLLHRYCITIL